MTQENDIVLIYFEDKPFAFARVEEILPDTKRDWYHVKLLWLQVPLQVVTWILRDVYINGEPFTMGGKNMRLEKVVCPADDALAQEQKTASVHGDEKEKTTASNKHKIISLSDAMKK